MTSAIAGGLSMASGLFGMIGGLRGAKAASSPGIAPFMYMLSGQEQQQAANAEADNLARQSSLAYEQSLIDAAQKDREVTAFKEDQALRFASSGVTLAGSPLAVLESTQQLGNQESAAIRRRGIEVSRLYEQEGLQMLRQGSAAAFSGFAQSLQSQFQAKQQEYQLKNQAFTTGLAALGSGFQAFSAGKSSRATRSYGPAPNTQIAGTP